MSFHRHRKLVVLLFLSLTTTSIVAIIDDAVEEKNEDHLLLCLDSMFHADRDRDDALTLDEYKSFVKYYSSRAFGTSDGTLPDEMKDLFQTLEQYSSGKELTGFKSINVIGSDPAVTPYTKKTRLEELRTMCTWIHGCSCCGICFHV